MPTCKSPPILFRSKLTVRRLPLIFLIYFNQQQDKSSVAFAAVFGFREDANLTGTDYVSEIRRRSDSTLIV